MYTDADLQLAKALGLDHTQIADIKNEHVKNEIRLNQCKKPHEFFYTRRLDSAYARCTKCGGTLPLLQARWYQLGLEHSKK